MTVIDSVGNDGGLGPEDRRRILHAGIVKLLNQANSLTQDPTTSRAVAVILRDDGITGRRSSGAHCPLANYLRRELPTLEHTTTYDLVVNRTYAWWCAGGAFVGLPAELSRFVNEFDAGWYPELEEPT